MFYESERIINKNRKYMNIRAYSIIHELERKGLAIAEQIASIDILLEDKNNEFQVDILNRAKVILNKKDNEDGKESDNPYNCIRINDTWTGGNIQFNEFGIIHNKASN